MFIFLSHLTVSEADAPALERHFRERAHLVDGFPGFLYLQLLRPESGPATHSFLTAWRDRAAFRAYMKSVEHATSHSREPGDIMRRTSVRHEAFEVLMDSRADPEWIPVDAALDGGELEAGVATPTLTDHDSGAPSGGLR